MLVLLPQEISAFYICMCELSLEATKSESFNSSQSSDVLIQEQVSTLSQ